MARLPVASAGEIRAAAEAAFNEFLCLDYRALSQRFYRAAAQRWPPERLAILGGLLSSNYGPLRSGRPAPVVTGAQDANVYTYPGQFKHGNADIIIYLNNQAELLGIDLVQTSVVFHSGPCVVKDVQRPSDESVYGSLFGAVASLELRSAELRETGDEKPNAAAASSKTGALAAKAAAAALKSYRRYLLLDSLGLNDAEYAKLASVAAVIGPRIWKNRRREAELAQEFRQLVDRPLDRLGVQDERHQLWLETTTVISEGVEELRRSLGTRRFNRLDKAAVRRLNSNYPGRACTLPASSYAGCKVSFPAINPPVR